MIEVTITSDLHGNLPVVGDGLDLMLVCGDVCPARRHYFDYQYKWVKENFCPWVKSLPYNDADGRTVMVWGNHDFFEHIPVGREEMDEEFSSLTDGRLVILNHGGCTYRKGAERLKLFGTPYCKQFYNWAFMHDDKFLEERFAEIPGDIDILISHDPASVNRLGVIHEGWSAGTDAGNHILARELARVKPRYYFAGHIHSGNHCLETVDGITMANVSYVNESYTPTFDPLRISVEGSIEV